MPKRKYRTEFGLNVVSHLKILLQQDDLARSAVAQALRSNPCHIYMVCRRPRISFVPQSVTVFRTKITGKLQIQRGATFETIPFDLAHPWGNSSVRFESEYPHTQYRFVDEHGQNLNVGKTANFAAYLPELEKHLRLEVLYVGQAYGTAGSRTAVDRLLSHSTLQGIYAEAIQRSPDQEIWLLLVSFNEFLLTSVDPRAPSKVSKRQEAKHFDRVTSELITEQQVINFTEAALIRYFQPPYNKIFKDSFPDPAHSTYSQCYDLDLNLINVEIQTDDLKTELWSEAVAPHWVHFATFPLHSREARRNMFEL